MSNGPIVHLVNFSFDSINARSSFTNPSLKGPSWARGYKKYGARDMFLFGDLEASLGTSCEGGQGKLSREEVHELVLLDMGGPEPLWSWVRQVFQCQGNE